MTVRPIIVRYARARKHMSTRSLTMLQMAISSEFIVQRRETCDYQTASSRDEQRWRQIRRGRDVTTARIQFIVSHMCAPNGMSSFRHGERSLFERICHKTVWFTAERTMEICFCVSSSSSVVATRTHGVSMYCLTHVRGLYLYVVFTCVCVRSCVRVTVLRYFAASRRFELKPRLCILNT